MKKEFEMEIAIKNIISIRRKAKPEDVADGIAWYAKAYEECRIIAERFDLPLHMVVGVVAALSRYTFILKVSANIRITLKLDCLLDRSLTRIKFMSYI